MGLVRTQVQLKPEQHRRLKEEAFRRGMSMSALLRDILEQRYGQRPRKKIDLEKAWAFVGAGRSGASDVSVHHDDYLSGKRK